MAKSKEKSNPAPKRAVGEASYVIDDRGRMQIADGQQVIKIERADVKRLKEFLDVHART